MAIPDDLLIPCSCCRADLAVMFIGDAGFCGRCRPPAAVLDDWDARVALVTALLAEDPPPCPHGHS